MQQKSHSAVKLMSVGLSHHQGTEMTRGRFARDDRDLTSAIF